MAAIDKIYGNLEKYNEFYQWCLVKQLAILRYFYHWQDEWLTDGKEHPICNLPEWADKWLLKHGPKWVKKYIRSQYQFGAGHFLYIEGYVYDKKTKTFAESQYRNNEKLANGRYRYVFSKHYRTASKARNAYKHFENLGLLPDLSMYFRDDYKRYYPIVPQPLEVQDD